MVDYRRHVLSHQYPPNLLTTSYAMLLLFSLQCTIIQLHFSLFRFMFPISIPSKKHWIIPLVGLFLILMFLCFLLYQTFYVHPETVIEPPPLHKIIYNDKIIFIIYNHHVAPLYKSKTWILYVHRIVVFPCIMTINSLLPTLVYLLDLLPCLWMQSFSSQNSPLIDIFSVEIYVTLQNKNLVITQHLM